MLILSRKVDESVIVKSNEGDIEIVVTEIGGGKVRLGINAPKGCKILREELLKTMEYNMEAAKTSSAHIKDLMAKFKK